MQVSPKLFTIATLTGHVVRATPAVADGRVCCGSFDGKVYALDQEGTLYVHAADPIGSVLATYSLRESCSATPAIAANVLFVRTSGHLYCIGSGK